MDSLKNNNLRDSDFDSANVKCGIETITPEAAQAYLMKNVGNRQLSKITVASYAQLMRDGLWEVNNDAISFNANGRLLNGQHRLSAVIEAGVPVKFFVVRGLATDSFVTMDNGKNRVAADALYTHGVDNGIAIAAVVKRKVLLEEGLTVANAGKGGNTTRIKISNTLILEEYYKYQEKYNEIASHSRSLYKSSRLLSAADYGGTMAYLVISLKHPKEIVWSFFDEFVEKKTATNNAIILLRRRLTQDKISHAKLTASARQKLLIKSWNAYIQGKEVKSLNYNEINDKNIWFV